MAKNLALFIGFLINERLNSLPNEEKSLVVEHKVEH